MLIGNLTVAANKFPWKVQNCDTDDPETWTGGNAKSYLLSHEPSPIRNIVRLNEFGVVYKQKSIYLAQKLTSSDIFDIGLVKTYHIPISGKGKYWEVFSYDGFTGLISTVDKITTTQ